MSRGVQTERAGVHDAARDIITVRLMLVVIVSII